MREMKPDMDEPKMRKKSRVSEELDLPLGELEGSNNDIENEFTEEEVSSDIIVENSEEASDVEDIDSEDIEEEDEALDEDVIEETASDSEDDAEEDNNIEDSNAEEEDGPTQEEIEEQRAYEARRAARAERNRIRKKKRRRKKILVTGLSVAAVAVLVAGVYFGDEFKHKVQEMNKAFAENINNRREEEEAKEAAAKAEAEKAEAEKKAASPENKLKEAEDQAIRRARRPGKQYDYDRAIKILKDSDVYEKSERLQKHVANYEKKKASCVAWPLEEVTHVFYHSMVVDTAKAFDGDFKTDGFNQVMTTIDEFNKITQSMYDKGYVMVSLKDIAKVDANGNVTPGEILLPPGKIPFVLSQDDVSYYHFMDGNGFATKLVLDEKGKVRNEYINDDGSVSVGDYDMVPLIDRFVEKHPDFSYRGAKGILALTGYNGVLGYRTDISYETRPTDLDADKVKWLDEHPDFSLEKERTEAKKVADAMKKNGWEFASHTWGHLNVAQISLERLQRDTERFKENVDPIIGGTDVIIFAFGADLNQSEDYSGDKFEYLKGQGYNYFCNVDSQKYFVQLRDRYFRMGRRNLDGYRMYYNPEMLADLFDAGAVFDPARPVPVPPMG